MNEYSHAMFCDWEDKHRHRLLLAWPSEDQPADQGDVRAVRDELAKLERHPARLLSIGHRLLAERVVLVVEALWATPLEGDRPVR